MLTGGRQSTPEVLGLTPEFSAESLQEAEVRISGKRSMAALARKAGALLRDRLGDNGSADLTAEQQRASEAMSSFMRHASTQLGGALGETGASGSKARPAGSGDKPEINDVTLRQIVALGAKVSAAGGADSRQRVDLTQQVAAAKVMAPPPPTGATDEAWAGNPNSFEKYEFLSKTPYELWRTLKLRRSGESEFFGFMQPAGGSCMRC